MSTCFWQPSAEPNFRFLIIHGLGGSGFAPCLACMWGCLLGKTTKTRRKRRGRKIGCLYQEFQNHATLSNPVFLGGGNQHVFFPLISVHTARWYIALEQPAMTSGEGLRMTRVVNQELKTCQLFRYLPWPGCVCQHPSPQPFRDAFAVRSLPPAMFPQERPPRKRAHPQPQRRRPTA